MTLDEAALSLRDDPGFATMSREDQELEAAELLGSDDPLEIALAIEAALILKPPALPGAGGGGADVEPCRNATDENPPGCGGREPVAANGRCMACGAYRGTPESETTVKPPTEPVQSEAPVSAMQVAQPSGIAQGEAQGPILARIKAATGMTDKELAAMLGCSRSAMHAYVTGFLPEKVTQVQLAILAGDIAQRLVILAALERDIRARIS